MATASEVAGISKLFSVEEIFTAEKSLKNFTFSVSN
jgi:hypothetical protein